MKILKQCKNCGRVLPKTNFYPKQAICKTCDRDRQWLTRYNLTPKQYLELYNKQNGRCAICGEECNPDEKLLPVDHDAKTGEIRGLLCNNCNLGLGHFKDSILNLRRAAAYLGFTDDREEF